MATTVTLKPNAIDISGSTSGTTTLQATAVAGTTTLTLPAATDTLVGKATTDTLTNKTLTSPTLTTPVLGTPSSGTVTNLTGTASININGTVGATTANTGAFTTLSATGVTTVQAGTAALPAITTTGDTNTGIFFPAADTIAFSEGGVESMRIDSSGNVGIGTSSPSAPIDVVSNSSAIGTRIRGRSSDSYGVLEFTNNAASAETARIAADSSNNLIFSNTGSITERMRIDSSGNVLVGTTSQIRSGVLSVSGVISTNNNINWGPAGNGRIFSDINWGCIFQADRASPATAEFLWQNAGGTSRMTLDTSGNLLVGSTAPTNAGKVISFFNSTTNVGLVSNDTSATAGATYFIASNNGTSIGSIARVGATSAVAYNTTSDQRLKSNITDSNSVLPTLMDVKVRQFDWTEGEVHQDYGFIAQELEATLSGVVTRGKTEDDMWQIDYARLTPHLVKAIQEQQALITALTTRITALETK